MRTLLIGAVSAMALFAGSALAAGSTTTTMQSPQYNPPVNTPPVTVAPDGTAGSSMSTTTTTTSGTTNTGSGTVVPQDRPVENGVNNSALQSQKATGTHCPPGTPDCRPGNMGGE